MTVECYRIQHAVFTNCIFVRDNITFITCLCQLELFYIIFELHHGCKKGTIFGALIRDGIVTCTCTKFWDRSTD